LRHSQSVHAFPTRRSSDLCGGCGERLPANVRSSGMRRLSPSRRPSFHPLSGAQRPWIGRRNVLAKIEAARERARQGLVSIRIDGEQGVGRSRLLAEVCERAFEDSDFVVGVEPDPTRGAIPYAPIKELVATLSNIEEAALAPHRFMGIGEDERLVRAGMTEILAPVGLRVASGPSDRTMAVAAMLAALLRETL